MGRGPVYYVTLSAVVAVLLLSANTSFADFPRLCQLLALDRFLPEPFIHRGRRLAFSYGIGVLAGLSALLLVVFRGITCSTTTRLRSSNGSCSSGAGRAS